MYGEGRQGGFRPRGGGGFGTAPVQVGEELDVRIEAVGEKGDGIARKRGFILFVPNTREGQEVRIRVTKVLRKVGFAEMIGEAQGTPEADSPRPAPAAAVMPEPAPPAPEDSEDFGEEQSEDFGEEPSEDFGEEAPEEESDEPEMDMPPEPPEEDEEKDM